MSSLVTNNLKSHVICIACLAVAATCVVVGCLDSEKKSFKDGDLVQVFQYGGPGDDFATAIVPLDDGGFVITGLQGGGEVFDGIDFGDLKEGETTKAFIARLDLYGNLVWVVSVTGIDPLTDAVQRARFFFAAVKKGDRVVVGGNIGGETATVENYLTGSSTTINLMYDTEINPEPLQMGAASLAFDIDDGEFLWHNLNGRTGFLYDGVIGGDEVFVVGGMFSTYEIYLDVNVDTVSHADILEFEEAYSCDIAYGGQSFVASYGLDTGDLNWAVPLLGCARGYDLALQGGSLALTGGFSGTLGFVVDPEPPNPIEETEPIPDSNRLEIDAVDEEANEYDAFVARLDVGDGAVHWARWIGGEAGDDYGLGVTFTSDDHVVVAGAFKDAAHVCKDQHCESSDLLETGPGMPAMFLAGYKTDSGTGSWSALAEVELETFVPLLERFSIVSLDNGGFVVGGGFKGTATFDPGGPSTVVLESHGQVGESDPFIARYGADGTLSWARSECGEDASGSIHYVESSTIAGELNIFAVGGFEGNAVFGAGEPNETALVSAPGSAKEEDVFVMQVRDE
jgi:hypothetical protein